MQLKMATSLYSIVWIGVTLKVPIPGGGPNEFESKASMISIVNAYIAACEAKAVLLNSKNEDLRRAAMFACLKAVFCKNSKEELLRELVTNNIEPKSYKIHHFLNTRFLNFLSEKEPTLFVDRENNF